MSVSGFASSMSLQEHYRVAVPRPYSINSYVLWVLALSAVRHYEDNNYEDNKFIL